MFDLLQLWSHVAAWLGDHAIAPVLMFAHVNGVAGNPQEIAEAGMIALLQISIIAFVFRPLENWMPAEHWPDRRLTRIDRTYTLLMLLGLFPLFAFLVLTPIANFFGANGDAGSGGVTTFGFEVLGAVVR